MTIEPIVPQNDILEEKCTYFHSKPWYVQHIHTREDAFTGYASIYAKDDENGYLTGF